VIADLEKVPVNAAGKVEFSADVYILRPLDGAKSNGVALVDVLNRGRKTVLTGFNRGGASAATRSRSPAASKRAAPTNCCIAPRSGLSRDSAWPPIVT